MPLKLNVGLSRKVGEANYGSRGASVNVEMELDSGLVNEPTRLQERIRQLFSVVRTSLSEELNGNNGQHPANNSAPAAEPRQNENDRAGNRDSGQRTNRVRPATQSQIKAIFAIAREQQINVSQFLRERYHVGRPEDLSIKEASTIIDELKNAPAKNGGRS
jgi:hypothetical protein